MPITRQLRAYRRFCSHLDLAATGVRPAEADMLTVDGGAVDAVRFVLGEPP